MSDYSLPHGYEMAYIDDAGVVWAVSQDTGEIIETMPVMVPAGTSVMTPDDYTKWREQKERQKARAEKEATYQERKKLRRETTNKYGNFFSVLCSYDFPDLTPEDAARLIYLLTYINYDQRIMRTQKIQMRYSDLPAILGVSRPTAIKFWKAVSKKYLAKDDNGGIYVSNPNIFRGKIPSEILGEQVIKFYFNGIRRLYNIIPSKQLRYFGNIIKILPFVNIEWNVLCRSNYETDLDKIEPLSVAELCEMLGYDPHNYDRFRKVYKKILFNVDGEEEYFLSYVSNGDSGTERMFINPKILYGGSDYRKVEVLGAFTKKKR